MQISRAGFRSLLAGISFSLFLVGTVGTAHADTITFKNGHEVHGRLVEETADYVIFQVGNGRLRYPKKDIATFTEDSDYGQRYFQPPKRADEAGGETQTPDGKVRKWTEHRDATSEERRDLRAVHARIVEELAKLGPSTEERERRLQLGPTERPALDAALAELGKPGRGRVDFSQFGPKAIGPLSEVLASGTLAARSDAASGVADAVTRGDVDDVKWALGKHKVATRLVAMLDVSGDPAAPAARNAANAALETIASTNVGWTDSKEPAPTDAQRAATQKWRDWATKDAAAFESGEKSATEKRKKHEEAWRALDDAGKWRRALADAVDFYGTTVAAKGGDKPTDKAGAETTNPDIAKEATPDEQKRLAELKTKIRTTLDKVVGPTLDERKKKYALSSEERQALAVVIHNLDQSGRRGSQNLIRQNAANELVTYGLKAFELLSEVLSADRTYGRWSAATAIAQIAAGADKDDVRALAGAYDLPGKILSLLDEQTDPRSAYVRADAAKALEAVTGQAISWPEGKEKVPGPEEVEIRGRWAEVVQRETADFQRIERAREEARKTLKELLGKLDGARSWRDALAAAPKAIEKAERELKR